MSAPARYSSNGQSFDLLRFTQFLEMFAYLSPAHAYSLHVTFLGLFPILMSDNEDLKREAIRRLNEGGLFALGVSEKAHGADLLANEFTLHASPTGGWIANGSKYYIGNSNAASMVSILAKKVVTTTPDRSRRAPIVIFALRPSESPGYQNVRKIRTLGIRTAFVGEFDVNDHSCSQGDFVAEGRAAWNAIAGTIDFGKFFLGFGAIGICSHALVDAMEHLRNRELYGRPVTDLPHIRLMTASAFARLMAMRLYAFRALDYLQAASADDRRYLLFTAVQKAKVSTEGVRVMSILSECIAAHGFEADTYFESALRE
jgi:acyl-CoA dehydrogenase